MISAAPRTTAEQVEMANASGRTPVVLLVQQERKLQMQRRDRARLVLRFGLSRASYLAIIGAGVLLLVSLVSTFTWVLVAAIVILCVVSLRNTWDLLVTVGEVTLGAGQDKD